MTTKLKKKKFELRWLKLRLGKILHRNHKKECVGCLERDHSTFGICFGFLGDK